MKLHGRIAALLAAAALLSASGATGQEGPRKAWLGISYVATDDGDVETVRIERVYPGSPAAAAGLRSGDEIVRWNGSTAVDDALEALRLQPGDTIRLRVRRGDERDRDLLVIATDRPRELVAFTPGREGFFGLSAEEMAQVEKQLSKQREEMARIFGENGRLRILSGEGRDGTWELRLKLDSLALHADSLHKGIQLMLRDSLGPQLEALSDQIRIMIPEGPTRTVMALGRRSVAGAEFEEMNEGLARYFGTDDGALVLRVSPGTPAARAGLRAGDVVLEVDDRAVDSVGDIRNAVARAQGDRTRAVQLEVLREGRRQEVDLRWE